MDEVTRMEISDIDLAALDKLDFDWSTLGDFYLTQIIRKANELGLRGKRIKEIVGIQENFSTRRKYLDFICE